MTKEIPETRDTEPVSGPIEIFNINLFLVYLNEYFVVQLTINY